MAQDDHALVVGIATYPAMTNLQGTERDALAFAQWLEAADGGAVPKGQIAVILSSHFQPTPVPSAAMPVASHIVGELEKHIDRAEQQGGRAGRRLYLYFAGHGFSPDVEEVAVLMANAAKRRTGHHIPGRRYAMWFQMAGYFDEIVLLMDCCREPKLKAPANDPPWEERIGQKASDYFYGFATCWSRAAREQPIQGGPVQGVFTHALLEGLSGGISPNANGQVTASMVEGFVRSYLSRGAIGAEVQVPDFDYDTPDRFVVLTGRAPRTIPVRVTRADGGDPADVSVTDGGGAAVASRVVGSQVILDLPSGLYKAAIQGGRQIVFEVLTGGGPLDVTIPA